MNSYIYIYIYIYERGKEERERERSYFFISLVVPVRTIPILLMYKKQGEEEEVQAVKSIYL